jgi:hypothetical protein
MIFQQFANQIKFLPSKQKIRILKSLKKHACTPIIFKILIIRNVEQEQRQKTTTHKLI